MDLWALLVKHKKILLAIVATIGVYFGFRYILPLFIPFLIAYLFALALAPVVRFLHYRVRFPLMAASVLALLLLISILGTAFFFFGSMLIEQLVKFLQNIPIYMEYISAQIEGLCNGCDLFFGVQKGTARLMVDDGMQGFLQGIQTDVIPMLTEQTLRFAVSILGVLGILLLILVSTLLLMKEIVTHKAGGKVVCWYEWVHRVGAKLSFTGIAYLRVQGILLSIIAVISTLGLFLIKNEYALLLGIGIAIFDAFPILGSGFVLIPWGIISLFSKNYLQGIILIVIFVVCQVIREFLEPKLLGDKIGIRPIFSLMAMYLGLRLFGIAGFLLGPLGLIIIMTVCNDSETKSVA